MRMHWRTLLDAFKRWSTGLLRNSELPVCLQLPCVPKPVCYLPRAKTPPNWFGMTPNSHHSSVHICCVGVASRFAVYVFVQKHPTSVVDWAKSQAPDWDEDFTRMPDTPWVVFDMSCEPNAAPPAVAAIYDPHSIPALEAVELFNEGHAIYTLPCGQYVGCMKAGAARRGAQAELISHGFNFAAVRQGRVYMYHHTRAPAAPQVALYSRVEALGARLVHHITYVV